MQLRVTFFQSARLPPPRRTIRKVFFLLSRNDLRLRWANWFRRWHGRVFSLERQRANFFPGGRPLYAYCPWWISHAVSLLHTFTIRGTGRPHVSRAAGVSAAAQYLVVAGAVHAYERMRELRAWWIVKSASFRQRTHLMRRAIARQGVVNWVMAHLKEFGAADAWRKP